MIKLVVNLTQGQIDKIRDKIEYDAFYVLGQPLLFKREMPIRIYSSMEGKKLKKVFDTFRENKLKSRRTLNA